VFSSVGWGEIVVLAVAALFIFGPERLPGLAQDAAGGLRRARQALTGVRGELQDALGDDVGDLGSLDVRRYHPRTLLREHLLGEDGDGSPSPESDPAPADDAADLPELGPTIGSRARTLPVEPTAEGN